MNEEKIEIELTINASGNISYKVNGIQGKDCTKETQFLDEALGEITKRPYKREYHESTSKRIKRIINHR